MTTHSLFSIFALCLALTACKPTVVSDDVAHADTGEETNTGDEGTAPHRCGGIAGLPCGSGEFCDLGSACHMPDAMGTCAPQRPMCTREFRPVCGCNGRTYPNACTAHADGVSILSPGECAAETPTSTGGGGVGATCGTRGAGPCAEGLSCFHPQTAGCGETDRPGTCQSRPTMCTMQYDPVCGCNGETYSNACAASAAGVSVRARGECAR